MSNSNDESKDSVGLDRRAVIRGAIAIGGATVLAGATTAMPQTAPAVVAEREWARALARHIANQLPDAISQVRDVQLSDTQVEEIRVAFHNTLLTNMGCEVPPS